MLLIPELVFSIFLLFCDHNQLTFIKIVSDHKHLKYIVSKLFQSAIPLNYRYV